MRVEESWPGALPSPYCDFSGAPRNATLCSPTEMPVTVHRNRFKKAYAQVAIKIVFDNLEYEIFRNFYQNDLDNGCAMFGIELRYPSNSDVSWWVVRLTGSTFRATYDEDHYFVDASLDLIVEIDQGTLYVLQTEGGSIFIPAFTFDNKAIIVKGS